MPDRRRRFAGPALLPGAGPLVLALLLLASPFLLAACGRGGGEGPGDPAREGALALGLPAGAELHRVTLGGRGAREHAVPTRIEASPGDALEFVTVDHRVHTVAFLADSLSPEGRGFLESTGQMESPPLPWRGSRFLVRLEGAPPGRYPFLAEGHGGEARGVLLVLGPGEPPSLEGP